MEFNRATGNYEVVCDFCAKRSGQTDRDPGESANKARDRGRFVTVPWALDHKLGEPLPWACPNCSKTPPQNLIKKR